MSRNVLLEKIKQAEAVSSAEVEKAEKEHVSTVNRIPLDQEAVIKEKREKAEKSSQFAIDKAMKDIEKQKADILAFRRDENLKIPNNINYDDLSGLSNEVKSKFRKIKPKTMGQALRIDGITPAAVYILLSHIKRRSIKQLA